MPPRPARSAPPVPPPPVPSLTWRRFLHGWALVAIVLAITILGCGIGFAWWVGQHLAAFSQAAGQPWQQVSQQVLQSWRASSPQQQPFTILLLGIDSLAQRGDAPPLTDTMMFVSFNPTTNQVYMLPLPRDLWSTEYQTKINALYTYGRERNPTQPEALTTQGLTQLTGINPSTTLVVSLDQVAELIDVLGGIEVEVPTGFVDEQFPRTDVDVTVERDPAKLYERIEFAPGLQTMSGERALKYIRSRHSEGDEGDDLARSRRQQAVLAALVSTLTQPATLTNTRTLGQLYRLYSEQYAARIPLDTLLAIAKTIRQSRQIPTLTPVQLAVFPDDPAGLITHPPLSPQYQNQWVYIVRDPATFAGQIQELLHLN